MVNPSFTILDHTADTGLLVNGAELSELFCNAARGMFTILCDPSRVRPLERVEVSVREEDTAYLLVDWLRELLYIFETRHLLFGRFEVNVNNGRAKGNAWGEPIDLSRHEIKTEIKAVTCHGLEVEKRDDVWTARIIFDL